MPPDGVEAQSTSTNVSNILEEARMILPGTQTLFGFQLVVIFNASFRDQFSRTEHYLHLGATALIVVAMAMLMAPAAYHRQAEPEDASRRFVFLASRLLAWALLPLAVAVSIEVYLVAAVVTDSTLASALLAAALFALCVALWYALPRRRARSARASAAE